MLLLDMLITEGQTTLCISCGAPNRLPAVAAAQGPARVQAFCPLLQQLMGACCQQHGLTATVILGVIALASAALPEDALFVPGTLPLDTDGKEVDKTHDMQP